MQDKYQSLSALIEAWGGGALLTIASALLGRLMWHLQEVRKLRRRFLGIELLWELPTAVGMALIGEGLASWLGFGQPAYTAVIASLAYLGPRGAEVLFMRWFSRKMSD